MANRPLVLLALAVLFLDFGLTYFGVIRPGEYYSEGDKTKIRGVIYSKQHKDGYNVFYLKDCYDKDNKIGRVILYEYFGENTNKGSYEIPISTKVEASVEVLKMRCAENEGGFDEKSYLISQEIFTKAAIEDIRVLQVPYFSVSNYLFELRERIAGVYEAVLPGEEAGILSTMALGDKSILEPEAGDLFSEAGLSHLFAISAMHISIVGMGLLSILSHILNRHIGAVISGCFVGLYAIMVGGSVSAVRAVGMFIVMLLAMVTYEAYDTLSAMALMAIIILVRNPFALYNVSFIFSFGVVACLVFLANPVADYYTEYCRLRWEKTHRKDHGRRFRIRFSQRIIRELLRGMSLQIASLPLVAYYYFSVPTCVIILNMILLPLLGVLLGCGLVGGLLGLCLPLMSEIFLPCCHYIIYFYEFMAAASTKLPFSKIIIGKPDLIRVKIYYVVIILVSIYVKRNIDIIKFEDGRQDSETVNWKKSMAFIGAVFTVLFLFISIRFSEFEVVMLSVGQGDGIFIDSGMGERYFVDGGSTSNDKVGKYVMKPFLYSRGVSKIDGWFLSHMDLDHVSGFVELVEDGFEVERLYLAKGIEEGEELAEIRSLCNKYNIDIIYMVPGDAVCCSKNGFVLSGEKRMEIECIAPDYPSGFSGPNENSQVLWLRYNDGWDEDFDCIFTGDIGEEQERAIASGEYSNRLTTLGEHSKIEVLKSAHHGSNSSNCSDWLSILSPRLCIISAGKNNRYGHPGKEAIARMDEFGLPHLCTIDCGQITLRWKDGETTVDRFAVD